VFVSMNFNGHTLSLLDQRKLPNQEVWYQLEDLESVAQAIETMVVRGAPAIAAAALFGLALESKRYLDQDAHGRWSQFKDSCFAGIERLKKTRPTAVNLFNVMDHLRSELEAQDGGFAIQKIVALINDKAHQYFSFDLLRNQLIGKIGSEYISSFVREGASLERNKKFGILTHCNTGSLATGGYGTALGIVRSLHSSRQLEMLYVGETRPWLQGSRLTAFEMKKEEIPFKLIADSAAAFAMGKGFIDAVIVGADRIAANGDTANKIGTYQLALAAAHHGIGFFVAASIDTIDFSLDSGSTIEVEERHPDELRLIGGITTSPTGVSVWNPSFDVTSHKLITAIVTEKGVAVPPFIHSLAALKKK
jgi:methylthioribose-1-phosphate isomerase